MWRILRPNAVRVLRDKKARASLARYFAVMADEKPANFMIAKRLEADFSSDDSIMELWKIHEDLTQEFYKLREKIDARQVKLEDLDKPEKSYLDLKLAIAKLILENCHFCTRRCQVNRLKGERGYCRCRSEIVVSTIFEHMGEEPELVPSGTVFTLGCTMRCLHCQNWSISQWYEEGEVYSPQRLAIAVEELRRRGCRNANLVGGEPTPWLQQWLLTFKYVKRNIPIVWNSNSYYSKETAKLLAGFADVYLLDFKYGSNECAVRISDAPQYWEACTRNHLYAKRYGELIIRILVLPMHLECCVKNITLWIAENLGRETRINVMFQYRPEWRAHRIPELRRRLIPNEMDRAVELAKKAGLTNFIT
ncbi:TPA: radical SAM protein [Candidatus Bathyarchaeota archaeon]|nr:radical SAM protein [Candidatus Bathyarchaeota archaeon]